MQLGLREGKTHPMEGLLNEALSKLPDFKGLVMRGAILNKRTKDFYTQLAGTANTFVEPAFVSTSKSFGTANMYSRADTLFFIESRHGKEIEQLSFFGTDSPANEKEVLLRSRALFLVEQVERIKYTTHVFLKEVEP